MGRGRKPTPTAILKLQGTYRHDRHSDRIDAVEGREGVPECPKWFDREGKSAWSRVTASLGELHLLSPDDWQKLAGLCQEWSVYVRTSKRLNAMKATDSGWSSTEAVKLKSINTAAFNNYCRVCGDFGLDPVSRGKIKVEKKEPVGDALDELMKRKSG